MKKFFIVIFIFIIVLIFISYLFIFNQSFKKNNFILYNNILIEDSSLNDYVLKVLACEMPASYNDEALKAQAIAIRTFALSINDYESSNSQCTISIDEMKTKWNNNFDKYYNKLKNIVNETNNIILTKNNKLFKTFYFSTSNGFTLNSVDVFNEGSLLSVDSSFDKESKDYKKEVYFSNLDLYDKLGKFDYINIINRDSTNHVLKICTNLKCYTGIEFRKLLNLRSTDFEIEIVNDQIKIITYGYGHGVGMSQYGANYLANKGFDYKYILNYYYGEVNYTNYV